MAKHVIARCASFRPIPAGWSTSGAGQIVVFNIKGEFFALANRCPHQGGSLCHGQLTGLVEASEPGEYRYSRRGEIIRCPWHGWEFDVRTGKSWCDPSARAGAAIRGFGCARRRAGRRPLCGGDVSRQRRRRLRRDRRMRMGRMVQKKRKRSLRKNRRRARLRLAADIGGTFTDIAVFDEKTGKLTFGKALSTPAHLVEGITAGVAKAGSDYRSAALVPPWLDHRHQHDPRAHRRPYGAPHHRRLPRHL